MARAAPGSAGGDALTPQEGRNMGPRGALGDTARRPRAGALSATGAKASGSLAAVAGREWAARWGSGPRALAYKPSRRRGLRQGRCPWTGQSHGGRVITAPEPSAQWRYPRKSFGNQCSMFQCFLTRRPVAK